MAGKLDQLTYEISRNCWNILGLCEVHWKNFGETSSREGRKLYFSGTGQTQTGFWISFSRV